VTTGRIAAPLAVCALGSSGALAEARFASLTIENDFFAMAIRPTRTIARTQGGSMSWATCARVPCQPSIT
jgi:hypothetical protein